MPDTIPVLPTVANVGDPELHVPPVLASVNAVVKPAQTLAMPVILAGNGFTVSPSVLKHPPGKV
jgi:hypothetical protein